MFKQLRRTKIVTTLGPATDHNNNLEKIIIAGTDIVRLNFSHGTIEDHFYRAQKVRQIANRLGKYIAILGDLQGPKVRISTFKSGKINLNIGDLFILDTTIAYGQGTNKKVGLDYKNLYKDVLKGDILLLDDGKIQLQITEIKGTCIFTKVLVGGELSDKKGINKLGGGLSASALTEKDKVDIINITKIGVDYLAISFPRSSEDLHYARKLVRNAGSNAKIVSKIERAEAVSSDKIIDDIILASDVVMIARGDLGVEIGNSELISIQKKLISRSINLNRAVITATQMMESMINNSTPTRAEVMDVANAVLDGTDAVMLSAETAIGKYPIETVTTVSKICLGAEKIQKNKISKCFINIKFNNIEDAVAITAMHIANHLQGVAAVITITESDYTSLIMSRVNSKLPILILSRHKYILNLTALYRGVVPIYFKNDIKENLIALHATALLKNKDILIPGDIIIMIQKDNLNITNNNIMRIIKVK